MTRTFKSFDSGGAGFVEASEVKVLLAQCGEKEVSTVTTREGGAGCGGQQPVATLNVGECPACI